MDENQKINEDNTLESLESTPGVTAASVSNDSTSASGDNVKASPDQTQAATPQQHKRHQSLSERLRHINVYMLAFCLLWVIGGAAAGFLYLKSKETKTASQNIASQSLSSSSLSQLANSGVSVGDPKQILNVQSNSIFAGKVLVRQDLEVAGRLLVGSSLSLTGITVSGQSSFDDVRVTKDLAVTGNAAIQGKVSARSIASSGDGNFGGTVTASQLVANSLQLNSNLTVTHHIIAGGATPGRSNGGALGSGGTSTVGGSDTSGSVTINTGSSPAVGCLITVNFSQKFNAVPHVIITPVNSAAANIGYYVTRATTSFSICDTSAAPANSSFGFDYLAIE